MEPQKLCFLMASFRHCSNESVQLYRKEESNEQTGGLDSIKLPLMSRKLRMFIYDVCNLTVII